MMMFALVLPESAGFKLLEDRLLFDGDGRPMIFESRVEAEWAQLHSPEYQAAEIAPLSVTAAEVTP